MTFEKKKAMQKLYTAANGSSKEGKDAMKHFHTQPWALTLDDEAECAVIAQNLEKARKFYFTDADINKLVNPAYVGNASMRARTLKSEVEAMKFQLIASNRS